ncbi:MAG: hypothetical protein AAF847_10550 [Bacteroidota bacterium]
MRSQQRAVVAVNQEMLVLYWKIGEGFAFVGRQYPLNVGNKQYLPTPKKFNALSYP